MGAPEEYFEKIMSRKEVYEATGIQVMNFNSLYQLYAMKRDKSSLLAAAKEALFIPDALSYMLTGKKVVEYTIASTSQMLNPRTKKFEKELLEKMGVDPELFGQIVMPGYVIGELTDTLAAETGLGKIPVVAVAGHDTASAVAAVPAKNEKFAYLSSGTWSLMGIEVKDPIITEETMRLNITNEGGVEGTTRLLKNITGMWILEQCIKEWKKEAIEYTYPEIVKMARDAEPFQSFIDPDDAPSLSPLGRGPRGGGRRHGGGRPSGARASRLRRFGFGRPTAPHGGFAQLRRRTLSQSRSRRSDGGNEVETSGDRRLSPARQIVARTLGPAPGRRRRLCCDSRRFARLVRALELLSAQGGSHDRDRARLRRRIARTGVRASLPDDGALRRRQAPRA